MKRIFIVSLLFLLHNLTQGQEKNPLLNRDFWKKNPSITTLQKLAEKGYSLSDTDPKGFDPTTLAILQEANDSVILYLLQDPKNPINKITHDKQTYLHWASLKGNIALVKFLIDSGADLNALNDKGMSALIFETSNGQISTELYQVFFQKGIDPKKTYTDGATILHLAIAEDKDLKLCNYLISKGLSLKDTDNKKRTLIDYASLGGNVNVMKKLHQIGVSFTPYTLFWVAKGTKKHQNSIEVFQYALEKLKLPINAVDDNGKTALHYIANKNQQLEGNSLIHWAVAQNNLELIKYIYSIGIDINLKNKQEETPLHIACMKASNTTILTYLLSIGANKNYTNNNGRISLTT